MRYQKPINIHTLLQDSPLAKMMQKGVRLNELNQQMKAFFPAEFAGLYRIANIEKQSLRIEVANAMVRQSFLSPTGIIGRYSAAFAGNHRADFLY